MTKPKFREKVENISAHFTFNTQEFGDLTNFTFNQMTSLAVGFTHQYNRSTTEITEVDQTTLNRQIENIEALYAQGNFTLFKQLNVMLGLRGEYIKSKRHNLHTGVNTTLWDEFTLFPTATLGMPIGKSNFLQFQLISQKQYPSFWAVSPFCVLSQSLLFSILALSIHVVFCDIRLRLAVKYLPIFSLSLLQETEVFVTSSGN